jgi:hypothetical protein
MRRMETVSSFFSYSHIFSIHLAMMGKGLTVLKTRASMAKDEGAPRETGISNSAGEAGKASNVPQTNGHQAPKASGVHDSSMPRKVRTCEFG